MIGLRIFSLLVSIPLKGMAIGAKWTKKLLLGTRVGQGLLLLAAIEAAAIPFVGADADATFVAVVGGVGIAGVITVWRLPERGGPSTGRGAFEVGILERLLPSGSPTNAPVAVDRVKKKDPDASSKPTVNRDLTTCLAGQSGKGKSQTAKSLALDWPAGATIAHAVSEAGGNEFGRWYSKRGYDVRRMSTAGSNIRWDPFLDYESTIADYQNIAYGVFNSRQIKSTGWDPGSQAMLLGGIITTDIKYGDFAHLDDILSEGPEQIIETINRVDSGNIGSLQQQFKLMDQSEMATVYSRLSNRLRPILKTDIFDPDIPSLGFTETFQQADHDSVVLLDSRRRDKSARGFWRFVIETGITLSYQVETQQRFLLDEVDKLPEISNLHELASAGRSANTRGIIIFQNVDQMDERYGETGRRTIWSNAANRFCFRPGDPKTAEMALESIGEYEVQTRDVTSESRNPLDKRVSKSRTEKSPIVSSDLFNLGIGEALIQSDGGWWLADLTERDVEA